jgi:polysaccharide export outer membrane protein
MKPDTSRLLGTLLLTGALIGTAPLLGSPVAATGDQAQSSSSSKQQQQQPPPSTPSSTQAKPPSSTAARPGTPTTNATGTAARPGGPPTETGVAVPSDYVIGPDDHLKIVFWREEQLSGEVVVRPDGKISLALLNDVQASGLTPNQLRESLLGLAARYVTDPSVTVIVSQINSRKVYVTGQVNKPGTYILNDNMTVLQMLAIAGGLQEWADANSILIMRTENGQTKSFKFNYKDVSKGKSLTQNIALKPGDTIVVP